MKLIRKLVLSIFSLMVVIVCFTTTTYAWFKNYATVKVESFEFKATSGIGFLVSIDNVNYSNDLNKDQLLNAVLLAQDALETNKKFDYDAKTQKLYHKGTAFEITTEEKLNFFKQTKLIPRTSFDGIKLTDMYNAEAVANDGSYVEFNVYFKATSEVAEDNKIYDIYLNGEDKTLIDGRVVNKTTITSLDVTHNRLYASLKTFNRNSAMLEEQVYNSGDTIDVYSSNAIRMSIQDTTLETPKAAIYELTNEYDLGSYATDYNGDNVALSKLYDSRYNAGFTYYNNLRRYNQISAIAYDTKPSTYRDITDVTKLEKVTRVKSGEEGKKVTFRIWLEGWDADCFDGIAKNINVALSFTSVKVSEGE